LLIRRLDPNLVPLPPRRRFPQEFLCAGKLAVPNLLRVKVASVSAIAVSPAMH
jgi:hypothetical protein